MKTFTLAAALALAAASNVMAQNAVINDYSDSSCSSYEKTTTVQSNGGECYVIPFLHSPDPENRQTLHTTPHQP